MPLKREHLPRWIKASFYTWFNDQLKDKINVFVETTEHVTKDGKIVTRLPTWVEFRINGPTVRPITKNSEKYIVTVNFLIETQLTGSNVYTHDNSVGIVFAAFVPTIGVFKYGTGPDDDQSAIDCFQLDTENVDPIVITNFGQLDPAVKLTQSTIEAHYCMNLDT